MLTFSALQRAENSSMPERGAAEPHAVLRFQCSSASRKFLNDEAVRSRVAGLTPFSALQRAENSSIGGCASTGWSTSNLSVLFSEPKIPQLFTGDGDAVDVETFSALQRAENSSIEPSPSAGLLSRSFQCSSASRKFLNLTQCRVRSWRRQLSVLFSEPKIPQSISTATPTLSR